MNDELEADIVDSFEKIGWYPMWEQMWYHLETLGYYQ